MITIVKHHDGGRTAAPAVSRLGGALLLLGLALGGTGCTQTRGLTEPTLTVTDAPIVLNSAPGAPGLVTATPLPPATSPPAAPGTVAATGVAPAVTPVAVTPVAPAPAPVALQPVAASAAAPEPLPAVAPAAEAGFPNINAAPVQPGGTLLPAEERARIIAELEALRARQDTPGGGAGGGTTSDLAGQAETHGADAIKQIEQCSEEGAAEKYPECAPVD